MSARGREVSGDLVSIRNEIIPSDTITITISRDCAEYFAERACTNDRACFTEVGGCVALDCHLEQACLAALEGEQ